MIIIELSLTVIIILGLGKGIKTGNIRLKENKFDETTMTPEYTAAYVAGFKFFQIVCIILFAITLISGYFGQKETYNYLRSDILNRGLIEDTGKTSEIKPEKYMMDDLILHVYSEDPASEEYIEAVNEQYEQWENLTFSQYLKRGVTDLFHIELRKERKEAIENMDVTNPTYWKLDRGTTVVDEKNALDSMSLTVWAILAFWVWFCAEFLPPGKKWWTDK